MPGRGKAMGHIDRGPKRQGSDDSGPPMGRDEVGAPGRSASSPGHLKRAAGEQSARDFAPGRSDRTGREVLPETAPDEMAKD
jgi:hypothetical protein